MKKTTTSHAVLSALMLVGYSCAAVIAGGNGSFETNTFTNPG